MKNNSEDLIHILKEKSPLAGQLADYEILELIQLMPLHSYRENETTCMAALGLLRFF